MQKIKNKVSVIILVFILAFSLTALCACGETNGNAGSTDGSIANTGSGTSDTVVMPDSASMFTDADKTPSFDEESAVTIALDGNAATASSDAVTAADGKVTISSPGAYVVSGTGNNVSIIVDLPADTTEKVRLVLDNVSITNDDFAAIYVKNADKTFIILKGENALGVTGDFVTIDENKVDGAVFSKDNIVFQGDGSLTIASSGHGIVGKDDVKFTGGTISVTAANHGVDANDSVRIASANVTIVSGKDGVHVENTSDTTKGYFYMESGYLKITAGYDGIDASGTVQVTGGITDITTGGGSGKTLSSSDISAKGIKATCDMLISDGTITVNSADDSVHSNGTIAITGGTLNLSSGDDGVHADTSLTVSGGTITITKSCEGLEAQNIGISGGKISIKASDDGLNAAGGNDSSSIGGRPGQNSFNMAATCFITISGGELYVNSSGDGIDSNGSLTVTGGTTIVEGPVSDGNGPLDYDGAATITGGTFVAIGSQGMAMNFVSANQGSVLLSVGSQSAGTTIALTDSDGNTLFTMTTVKSYASVLISVPDMVKGGTYTLKAGSFSRSVTLSSLVYGSSSGMGGGNPGGNPGGGRPGGRM